MSPSSTSPYPIQAPKRVRRAGQAGFTLAEMIIASTLLTFVMAAIYTSFSSTLRAQGLGEEGQFTYQDVRVALATMSRELNCIVGGSEYLFEGKDDELSFYAVTPPMNPKEGRGPRLMWIRYRFNRNNKKFERTEALVKKPFPLIRNIEEAGKRHPDLKRKRKFTFIEHVRRLNITYWWLPPQPQRKPEDPPEIIDPVMLEENMAGWGLPQNLKISITVDDPHSETGRVTFVQHITFLGPTTPYDEERMGLTLGAKS